MFTTRMLTAITAAALLTVGTAYAKEHHKTSHHTAMKHEDAMKAKCEKDAAGDAAKMKACHDMKGGETKMAPAAEMPAETK